MDLNKVYAEMAENLGMSSSVKEPKQTVRKIMPYNSSNPKRLAFRNKVVKESATYQEECAKHLLLDIYMKILPLDKEYVDCNRDQCMDDVKRFLASKGMTAMQYFNSAASATNAPMMESIIDNLNAFGKGFVEQAMEENDEAANGGTEIEAPETKEEDVNEQIVDITDDMEYENFVDVLKKKTVDKIVNDISALIVDTKEDNNMVFDPKEGPVKEEPTVDGGPDELLKESALAVTLDYVTESCSKVGAELPADQDEVMGMAIRESTLNMIDRVFEQPGSDIKQFGTRLRLGKGVIVTESAVKKMPKKHNVVKLEKMFNRFESSFLTNPKVKTSITIPNIFKLWKSNTSNSQSSYNGNKEYPDRSYYGYFKAKKENPHINIYDLYKKYANEKDDAIIIKVANVYAADNVSQLGLKSNMLGTGINFSENNNDPNAVCFMQIMTDDLPDPNVFGNGVKVVQILTHVYDNDDHLDYQDIKFVTHKEIPKNPKFYRPYWTNPSKSKKAITLNFSRAKQYLTIYGFVNKLCKEGVSAKIDGYDIKFTHDIDERYNLYIPASVEDEYSFYLASINGIAYPTQSDDHEALINIDASFTSQYGESIGDCGCVWVEKSGKADWDCY